MHVNSTKVSLENAYGVTSLQKSIATPQHILEYNRGHWSIENKLHYVRDVTYGEDGSQIKTKNGPNVMASLRNFAISIMRLLKFKNIASAIRKMAAKPYLALKIIGI